MSPHNSFKLDWGHLNNSGQWTEQWGNQEPISFIFCSLPCHHKLGDQMLQVVQSQDVENSPSYPHRNWLKQKCLIIVIHWYFNVFFFSSWHMVYSVLSKMIGMSNVYNQEKSKFWKNIYELSKIKFNIKLL